jgi:hypothetical protein
MRRSHIISAFARMFLISKIKRNLYLNIHFYTKAKILFIETRVTREGEIVPANMQELSLVSNPKCSDRLLFMPIIIEHRVDKSSPLYDLIDFPSGDYIGTSSNVPTFKHNNFEIVVLIEGTVESTGQSTQARTSYLPLEIKWNHVFEPLISVSSKSKKATLDFSKFDVMKSIEVLKELKAKRLLKYLNSKKTLSIGEDKSYKNQKSIDEEDNELLESESNSPASVTTQSSTTSHVKSCFESTAITENMPKKRASERFFNSVTHEDEWTDFIFNETARKPSRSFVKSKRAKLSKLNSRRATMPNFIAIPISSINKNSSIISPLFLKKHVIV